MFHSLIYRFITAVYYCLFIDVEAIISMALPRPPSFISSTRVRARLFFLYFVGFDWVYLSLHLLALLSLLFIALLRRWYRR